MGAIGACVSFGNYPIALLLCALNYASLAWITPLEEKIKKEPSE